ncbi:MAG: phosphotransferase [Acidimicrobiia bacterium]|nr:phosphotransferase [Acidimicrobiia bacterium]
MNPYVVDRYTEQITTEIAEAFGVARTDLTDLGGFEAFVYEFSFAGEPAILKVSHSDRRSPAMLRSEAVFTRFLQGQGISVASVILSPSGNEVETVEDGHGAAFLGVAWTRAPGERAEHQMIDTDYWHEHGRVLGRMHVATQQFTNAEPWFSRPHWDSPVHLADSLHIPDTDPAARSEVQRLLAERRSLPTDTKTYGLVHMDAHNGNSFWDGATVTLIDFDDCGYSWYADDLAIVMYYGLRAFDDPTTAAETIWPAFIAGYQEEHRLDRAWFSHFPAFLSWRDHLLYSIVHRSLQDDDEFDVDAWVERFHRRQAGGGSIIDYDFTTGVIG